MNKYLQTSLASLACIVSMSLISCESREQEFVSKLKSENFEDAVALVADGLNVNGVDENGTPMIIHAVKAENLEIVKGLVYRGVNVNAVDGKNKTALTYAVLAGEYRMAQFLLSKGADKSITLEDQSYMDSFFSATSEEKEYLINTHQMVADEEIMNRIFFAAIENGKAKSLKCIFRNLALSGIPKSYEKASIYVYAAIETDNPNIYDTVTAYGPSPSIQHLSSAIDDSKWQMAKHIISKGVDINAQTDRRSTLIEQAINEKNYDKVEKLISLGADINATSSSFSPLANAILREELNREHIGKIVKWGANVNAVNGMGENLLMEAIRHNKDIEVVRLLIELGVDVNYEDKYGTSVMSVAIKAKREDCVELLQKSGGSLSSSSSGSRNESEWLFRDMMTAAEKGDATLLKNLITAGIPVNKKDYRDCTPLMIAASGGHLECVKILVDAGADVNAIGRLYLKSSKVHTALECALAHPSVVQYLIQKGADVNSMKDFSPLHIAAMNGYDVSAKILIEAGANVNCREPNYRKTPLIIAATEGHVKMVQCLLEAGAKRKLKDVNGYTALRQARAGGYPDIIKLLQAK